MKKIGSLISILLLVCLLLAGCSTNGRSSELETRPLHFAFVTCAVDAKFFEPVKKGMNDAADMMTVECDFIGTEGVDVQAQARMVRQAVEDGYDGIAVNIIDSEACDRVIREAVDKKIPVVGFNVDDHATPNARLGSVNQRLYEAGQSLAKLVSRHIPDGAHVLMTMHHEGVSALEDRLAGEQAVLKKKNIRWTVIVTGNYSANGTDVVAGALKANPDIRIIMGTGQSDTEAAGRAIEKSFAGQGYWSAGFDLSPETLRLIRSRHIRCTVDQQPYIQGFYPVIQLTLYLRYGIVPSDTVAESGRLGVPRAVSERRCFPLGPHHRSCNGPDILRLQARTGRCRLHLPHTVPERS